MKQTRTELDLHADTSCFGSDCTIVSEDLSQTAVVTPFLASFGKVESVPICTVAVAYDDLENYTTYILIFHQVLYFKDLRHNLLCPNQLRLNGVTVNECPLMHTRKRDLNEESHSIVVAEDNLLIPLQLDGVISYFITRKPTHDELNFPE